MPDVSRAGPRQTRGMQMIRIVLETPNPPTGEVAVVGSHPARFTGWLGMLRVLSEIVGTGEETKEGAEGPGLRIEGASISLEESA